MNYNLKEFKKHYGKKINVIFTSIIKAENKGIAKIFEIVPYSSDKKELIKISKTTVDGQVDGFTPKRGKMKGKKILKKGKLIGLYNEKKELIAIIVMRFYITNEELAPFGLELLPHEVTKGI